MAADPLSPAAPLAEIDPAWAWSPLPEKAWTRELGAHLYRRAGFGATWAELDAAAADGCQRTVERLVSRAPASDRPRNATRVIITPAISGHVGRSARTISAPKSVHMGPVARMGAAMDTGRFLTAK